MNKLLYFEAFAVHLFSQILTVLCTFGEEIMF